MNSRSRGSPGRRAILSAAIASPVLLAAAPSMAAEKKTMAAAAPLYAYVGSFTTEKRKARGDGIHVYRVDPATAAWTHVQSRRSGEKSRPTCIARPTSASSMRCMAMGLRHAYGLDPASGRAKRVNRAATGGKNGVRQGDRPGGKCWWWRITPAAQSP